MGTDRKSNVSKINHLFKIGSEYVELRDFCASCFAKERQSRKLKNVSLQIKVLPVWANGLLRVKRKKAESQYTIIINLFPFLIMRKASLQMRFFYLHTTIVHELRHVELLNPTSKKDYCELLAFWEESRQFGSLKWVDVAMAIVTRENIAALKKRKYSVSMAEILCNLSGYQSGYAHFKDNLTYKECQIIETTLTSLEFLRQHIVIGYSQRKYPYNSFVKMIREVQAVLQRKVKLKTELTPMYCLFNQDGTLKSFEQIAKTRTESNAALVDPILINLYICAELDYPAIFMRSPEIKQLISLLANQYCNMTVCFLQEQEKGKVFLDNNILMDNSAMLIKNTNRVNILMTQHNIPHTGGTVIPLYNPGH